MVIDRELGWLCDTVPSRVLARHEDGAIELSLVVRDVEWFTRLLLRLGSGIREVDQKLFAQAATDRARKALALYR